MEMVKQDHGQACEKLRDSMEARAALIYCFVKAAKELGMDYLTLGRKAMFDSGVWKANTLFHKTEQVDELAGEYMPVDTIKAFDGELLVCNSSCLLEESTYCPLVAAWQKLTDDEQFLEELCDIAMCGDRGILSCYPSFQFELLGTLFDGDRCKVRVTKKEEV